MNKKGKEKIIKIIIIVCLLIGGIVCVYSYIKLNKAKEETYKEQVFTYLTTTYKNDMLSSSSPFLGLLNYNFEDTNITLSTQTLIHSNLMLNSQLNEIGIDNIYNSIYGVSRSEYITKNNILVNENSSCYYQRDVNNVNLDCDRICSLPNAQIRDKMSELLQWTNVLENDAVLFCIKSSSSLLEGDGYFVNLNDMKSIYKNITNNELNLNSEIINNKYYTYGSYLVTIKSRLENKIKEISSVDKVKVKDGIYTVDYTALTERENELKGKVKLKRNEDDFYVLSNEINTNNILK